MNLNFKNLMDAESGKVLIAAISGIGGTAAVVDYSLKFIISILTIIYLWRKILPKKTSTKNERENDEDPLEEIDGPGGA